MQKQGKPYVLSYASAKIMTDSPAIIDPRGMIVYSSKAFFSAVEGNERNKSVLPPDIVSAIISDNSDVSSGCFARSDGRLFFALRYPPNADSALLYPTEAREDDLAPNALVPISEVIGGRSLSADIAPFSIVNRLFSNKNEYQKRVYCALYSLIEEWRKAYAISFDHNFSPQISFHGRANDLFVLTSPAHFFSMLTAISDMLLLCGGTELSLRASKKQGRVFLEISADCGFCRFVSPLNRGSEDTYSVSSDARAMCGICIELCAKANNTHITYASALLGERAYSLSLTAADYDRLGLKAIPTYKLDPYLIRALRALYSGREVTETALESARSAKRNPLKSSRENNV